jgi:nucleotide-binding universal stress UspA family protein
VVFRNILVGYDGSERSEDALALALALAGAQGKVTAAASYWFKPLSARVTHGGPGQATMRSGAEATLAPLRYRGGAVIETVAAPGVSPAAALRDLAEEQHHDLVVVGSTHRGPTGRVLAGTTADALLRGGPCPVAVAPLGYRERVGGLRRIGVAFDGSAPARVALDAAQAIAADRAAALVVLRAVSSVPVLAAGDVGYGFVVEEPALHAAAQAELDDSVMDLGAGGLPVTGELLEGDPGAALAERSEDLDLLVVGSKGHGALGRFLLGSVSHHLMCESAAPVLVVPGRARHNALRGGSPPHA